MKKARAIVEFEYDKEVFEEIKNNSKVPTNYSIKDYIEDMFSVYEVVKVKKVRIVK